MSKGGGQFLGIGETGLSRSRCVSALGGETMEPEFRTLDSRNQTLITEPPPPDFRRVRATSDMITAIYNSIFTDGVLITFYLQGWHNLSVPWLRELIWEIVKNKGKYIFIKIAR